MLEKLRVVFTIPELRKKIFLTLALLAIYRVGYQIRLPILTPTFVTIAVAWRVSWTKSRYSRLLTCEH